MTTLDPYANKIEYGEMYSRKSEDGDDFISWAVFPNTMSDQEIFDYCYDYLKWNLVLPDFQNFDSYHREPPSITRVGNRVLVKQKGTYQ